MIRMKHEGVDGVGYALNDQVFAAVWAPKGWTKLGGGAAEEYASETLSRPVQDLDELKVDDLVTLTEARGFQGDRSSKKAAVAALRAAFDGTGQQLEAVPTAGFQPGVVDPNSAPVEPVPTQES